MNICVQIYAIILKKRCNHLGIYDLLHLITILDGHSFLHYFDKYSLSY